MPRLAELLLGTSAGNRMLLFEFQDKYGKVSKYLG